MIMNDALGLVLAWVTGALLGAMFFGGLWWTVRKGFSSQRPALWLLGSLLLRMSIALDWILLCCPPAVIGSDCWCASWDLSWPRLIVTRLTRAAAKPTYLAQDASHAP